MKGEGDLTIADRLGAKDDCIIVINNKKLKFANIYDAEKITDRNKVALYFDYIKIVRKYCKRYINKEYLLNLCDFQL